MSAVQLTLYSRSYCHLCEQMRDALQPLRERYRFTLEVVDVDADPALVAQYDELVPVLIGSRSGGAPLQLCHYFLDAGKVEDFLSRQ
jgi:thiol-disulfide isomerase/thioredoxin